MNLTVGAGIFVLPAVVAGMLGRAALLAYMVCGVLAGLVLACFAEVGSRVTRSGGAVAYVEEAFGPLAGFLAWVTFTIGFAMASDAAIANLLVDTLSRFLPALGGGAARIAALTTIFGLLAVVNIYGVRHGTRLAVSITVVKLLPLLLLIALGAMVVDSRELTWSEWPSVRELGAAALVLFFAFAGVESSLTPSGEIRDPARTVPRGILGAAGALLMLYLALHLTAQGVLGDGLALETEAPLAAVAHRVMGPAGLTLILAGTALSVFGTLSADMIGSPRAVFAMAESGMLPRILARVHPRHRTPWVAILAFASATLLVAISGAFRPLAVMASIALLLIYLAVCLAALRFRYAHQPVPGAFRTPGGPLVPVLGSLAVLWLLSNSTLREAGAMAAALILAGVYYMLRKRARTAVA